MGEQGPDPPLPLGKDQRRVAAMQAEMARVVRRLYSLSVTMMRVDAAWEAYHAEMTKVVASGKSDDEIVEHINEQVFRVENNDFLRASAHLTVCHALLYVAVEGWRKWKFFDARVDKLLENPRANELKKYRHAIFHADHFDHEQVEQFSLAETQDKWSAALQNELRRALRDWHANLDQRIAEYLRRSPL